MIRFATTAISTAALMVLGAGVAHGQPAPAEPPAAPAQLTQAPMVPAGDATHVATLRSTAAAVEGATPRAGTAWVLLDPQNNSMKWTIEYTGVDVAMATLVCSGLTAAPGAGAAPATPAAGSPTAGNTIDLAANGTNTPIQGETAGLGPEMFAAVQGGNCIVVLGPAARGPGGIRGALAAVPTPAPAP